MTYIIIVLIAYLLGSFCCVDPAVKACLRRRCTQKRSGGNAGATNMARVYGMKAGIATFMLDAVKPQPQC